MNKKRQQKIFFTLLALGSFLFLFLLGVFKDSSRLVQIPAWDASSDSELNLIVLGDWGKRGLFTQDAVARQMGYYAAGHPLDFIVTTGDNFYEHGVKSVNDPKWKKVYEDVYRGNLSNIPWYVSLGNHDYEGNVQAELDYTQKNNRWHLPARYYSFVKSIDNGATARFIILDTTPFIQNYRKKAKFQKNLKKQDVEKQLQWLEKTLANSTADWNIVIGHHPIYSAGPKYGDTKELVQQVKPILEKHPVQLYLCGHEHALQHLSPPGSIHYFISSAGHSSHKKGLKREALFFKKERGFLALTMHEDEIKARFIDRKGKKLYSVSISKNCDS